MLKTKLSIFLQTKLHLYLKLKQKEVTKVDYDTVWNKIVQKRKDGTFLSEALLEEPELFHQRLILRAVEEQIGGRKDVTGEHIRSVKGLFFASCGKQICLPDGITAWKEKEGICIGRQSDTEGSDEILELTAPGCFSFEKQCKCGYHPACRSHSLAHSRRILKYCSEKLIG